MGMLFFIYAFLIYAHFLFSETQLGSKTGLGVRRGGIFNLHAK
jgi:hypothetical protein